MSSEKFTVVPIRLGIRFSPPALVYVYERKCMDGTNSIVLRRRIMPVRDFFQSSDVESTANTLVERHGKQLFDSVPFQTVCKMLRLLREYKNGVDLKTALEIVEEEAKELEGIDKMLNKTDGDYKRLADTSKNNSFALEKEGINSKLPCEAREKLQDLDIETTWNDDDGEDSLEFPLDKVVT